jgi:flagellin
LTTADGVQQDGNVSLNVTNLQYLTSLGGLDTTYITETAAAIIEAQKLNNEQANNSDGNGERSFINIGNVNGDNSNDWTDNSTTNAIIGTIPNPDSVDDFTIGAITTGTQAKENGIVYDLGSNVANWADGAFNEDDVVYHQDSGRYYKANTAVVAGEVPGADAKWTDVGTTLAELQADGDFGVTVGTAANFTDQAAVNAYMQNEIYTEDNFLKSIMFVSMGTFTDMIERIADARAENGAEQNRLNMTSELLVQNQTNLEAAHGRIMDADVALESTRFARQNVLVQSSAAMVAQANQLTNIALTILG